PALPWDRSNPSRPLPLLRNLAHTLQNSSLPTGLQLRLQLVGSLQQIGIRMLRQQREALLDDLERLGRFLALGEKRGQLVLKGGVVPGARQLAPFMFGLVRLSRLLERLGQVDPDDAQRW